MVGVIGQLVMVRSDIQSIRGKRRKQKKGDDREREVCVLSVTTNKRERKKFVRGRIFVYLLRGTANGPPSSKEYKRVVQQQLCVCFFVSTSENAKKKMDALIMNYLFCVIVVLSQSLLEASSKKTSAFIDELFQSCGRLAWMCLR